MIEDVVLTPLKIIDVPGGRVFHAIKNIDPGFDDFGEAYFSEINSKKIKAWKRHREMTLNLVVPIGEICFVFHLAKQKDEFRIEKIGKNCYSRLTVPPGIWFGFKGLGTRSSLLMNVADMEHDPNEVLHKSAYEYNFDWSVK